MNVLLNSVVFGRTRTTRVRPQQGIWILDGLEKFLGHSLNVGCQFTLLTRPGQRMWLRLVKHSLPSQFNGGGVDISLNPQPFFVFRCLSLYT